jgi:uncharacterized repeat protein (TIGR03833 family)
MAKKTTQKKSSSAKKTSVTKTITKSSSKVVKKTTKKAVPSVTKTKKTVKKKSSSKKTAPKMNKHAIEQKRLEDYDWRRLSNIKVGSHVKVEESQYAPELIEGNVKQILTHDEYHEFGIKVELDNGKQGRVKQILDKDNSGKK